MDSPREYFGLSTEYEKSNCALSPLFCPHPASTETESNTAISIDSIRFIRVPPYFILILVHSLRNRFPGFGENVKYLLWHILLCPRTDFHNKHGFCSFGITFGKRFSSCHPPYSVKAKTNLFLFSLELIPFFSA